MKWTEVSAWILKGQHGEHTYKLQILITSKGLGAVLKCSYRSHIPFTFYELAHSQHIVDFEQLYGGYSDLLPSMSSLTSHQRRELEMWAEGFILSPMEQLHQSLTDSDFSLEKS
jgi:hypothetical protein